MKTVDIKQRLHEYIETAKDKKLRAIYTMVEEDIDDSEKEYDDEFYAELLRRQAEMESGEVETYTWEQVQERAEKSLEKTKV